MNKKIEKAKVIEILDKCKTEMINDNEMCEKFPLPLKMLIAMDRIETINKIKKGLEKEI